MSEVDDEDDEDGNRRVAFDRVHVAVAEQGDDERDEGNDDDPCGFGQLVRVGNGAEGGSSDNRVDRRLEEGTARFLVCATGG